ncbi:MAG: H/ACA ribonucleoprotein complex subunit GAR1/NAF1 [Desulfurococcaceae archaeon]
MKELGVVETVVKDGYLVVKPILPRNVLKTFRAIVFDEKKRRIGKVMDIIGRVDDPRIVVKLEKSVMAGSITSGQHLYFLEKKRSGGRHVK